MKSDIPTFESGQLDALASVNAEVVKQVSGVFLRTGRERVDAIVDALRDGDWVQVHGLAHSLKGSAASVGAARLAAIAAVLETESGHERPSANETTEQAGESLGAEFERARGAIEAYLEALGG